MLQPPSVLPADPSIQIGEVKKVSDSIPVHIRTAMKSGKTAARSDTPPPSSGAPNKSRQFSLEFDKLTSTLSTTHPHLAALRLLADWNRDLETMQHLIVDQQNVIAKGHNEMLMVLAQLQASQRPIRAWMEKVAGATVMTQLTIQFPTPEPAPEYDPAAVLPDAVMELPDSQRA